MDFTFNQLTNKSNNIKLDKLNTKFISDRNKLILSNNISIIENNNSKDKWEELIYNHLIEEKEESSSSKNDISS